MKSLFKKGLLFGFLSYCAYDYQTKEQIFWRNMRTLRVGISIIINYKFRFTPETVDEIHEYTAHDIYNLCKTNDGLYVKFGQGVAASEHMLPPAYFKYFSKLQDQANSCEYKEVEKIIQQEFGKEIPEMFQSFEQKPVASASIAQVHRATLKDGTLVAVKIQKPNIKKQFKSDMFMHWLFCAVLDYAFNLPILSFANTIERNLEKEIDFRIEAQNAELCRKNFQMTNRLDVYIPKIYSEYTTPRTIVMEWIDGIKITHTAELAQQNLNISQILEKTVEAFAEQIFVSGFIHADPHPGNIFVRKSQYNNKYRIQSFFKKLFYPDDFQIIILDFGLCFPLRPEFRQQYCQFWKSMFLQNSVEMLKIAKGWGVLDDEFFASAQLLRPYKKDKPLTQKISKQEVFEMQMKFKEDFRKMLGDTSKFPDELIFIGRNMNLVRSINKRCGSPVNRINIMAKYSVKGLDDININMLQRQINLLKFRLRLMFSSLFYRIFSLWLRIFKKKGFEDYVEDTMKQGVQERYKKYGMKPPDENTFNA